MLTIIVAMDEQKGIGYNGALPWHIRQDLQLFKANTWDQAVVMGQTTYEKLPAKLANRRFYVASNDPQFTADADVVIIRDLKHFLQQHQDDADNYFICGGASIYRLAYPFCRQARVSFVRGVHQVDTWFDSFDMADWQIDRSVEYEQFDYREMTRKGEDHALCRLD